MRQEILRLLRKAGNHYVSGEEIAETLGVSRTAIWKHIKELRRAGYDIVSQAHSGYRLEGAPDLLTPAELAPLLKTIRIDMAFDEAGRQKMLLDGKDVSREIRLPEISMYASNVSALPCVRAYLLEMQRDIARKRSVIMDGRDIGTVVLPDADLKIYLTASAEERARRRCLELSERGTPEPYEAVLREINERDEQDMHRAIAPLREAADAIRLDTSALNFDESEQALLKLIQEKLQ